MATDLRFDPVTKDLIDADDGWFEETATAETAVWLQLESHLGEWWGDPGAGSLFHNLSAFQSDPETLLRVEGERCLGVLEDAGLISRVEILVEPGSRVGRYHVATRSRDTSTGQLVDTFVRTGA